MPTGSQLLGSAIGKDIAKKRKKLKKNNKVDAVTGAGKITMRQIDRARRLAKRDRINREKKNKPFLGSENDPSVTDKQMEQRKLKNKVKKLFSDTSNKDR